MLRHTGDLYFDRQVILCRYYQTVRHMTFFLFFTADPSSIVGAKRT